jgi:uncharacterized membrane protein
MHRNALVDQENRRVRLWLRPLVHRVSRCLGVLLNNLLLDGRHPNPRHDFRSAPIMDATTTILGIQIPSIDPLFVGTIIAVHIPLGLASIIAGPVAMLSRKGRGRHSTAGTIYYWSLTALAASAALLSAARWSEDYDLFIFGALAFIAASIGRAAARGHWPYWTRIHIAGMGSSYVLMLVAFYVDNGKQLPVWKNLPHFTYWLIPIAIGVPVIVWTLTRHPLRQLGDSP